MEASRMMNRVPDRPGANDARSGSRWISCCWNMRLSGTDPRPRKSPDSRPNTDTLATMNISSVASLAASLMAFSLAGCASGPDTAKGAAREGVQLQKAVEPPRAALTRAREKIPAVLQAAVKAPYALPSQRDCPALANEVRALNDALGADLDT